MTAPRSDGWFRAVVGVEAWRVGNDVEFSVGERWLEFRRENEDNGRKRVRGVGHEPMGDGGVRIICPHCGKAHEIGEIEMAYAFPDDYFALPEAERKRRGQVTPDFCQLDMRFFIRAVIPVPMLDRAPPYCWGAWIELSQEHFMIAYNTWEDDDVSYLPRLTGRLANRLHEYEASKGLIGELELKADTRPFFYVLEESALKEDQHLGITCDDAIRYYHGVAQPLAHA